MAQLEVLKRNEPQRAPVTPRCRCKPPAFGAACDVYIVEATMDRPWAGPPVEPCCCDDPCLSPQPPPPPPTTTTTPAQIVALQTPVPATMRFQVIYKFTSTNLTNQALIRNTIIPLARKALDKYMMVSQGAAHGGSGCRRFGQWRFRQRHWGLCPGPAPEPAVSLGPSSQLPAPPDRC